jgi:hypothetical protein
MSGGGGTGSGGQGRAGGAPRPPRSQQPPDRPIYQVEERYWTDYLRVALPVVGLLLLLGLFWYWASSLIGDDATQAGATPTTGVAVVITEVVPTPEPTLPVVVTVEETEAPDVEPTQSSNQPVATRPADNGSSNMGDQEGGAFDVDETVVVNDDNVRMRSQASTSASIIEQMTQGTELVITGEAVVADGYTWWPVEDPATGNTGWVAEDFLEPS